MFDYDLLRKRIRAVYGTQNNFAKALNIGRVSLNQRLNNVLDWTQPEMEEAARLLGFSKKEIPTYFFKEKVQESEQM